jgi:hypothetical protein
MSSGLVQAVGLVPLPQALGSLCGATVGQPVERFRASTNRRDACLRADARHDVIGPPAPGCSGSPTSAESWGLYTRSRMRTSMSPTPRRWVDKPSMVEPGPAPPFPSKGTGLIALEPLSCGASSVTTGILLRRHGELVSPVVPSLMRSAGLGVPLDLLPPHFLVALRRFQEPLP